MATTSKFDFGLINDQIKAHADQIANVEKAVAKVENGTTATQTINLGDYVYRNGALYKYGGSTIATGVTIPAFSESWIVSGGGFNALKTGLEALNTKIDTVKEINGDTQIDFENNLKSAINELNNGGQASVKVICRNVTGMINSSYYMGRIYKNQNNYGACVLYHHSGIAKLISLSNGVFTFKSFSLIND